MSAEDEIQERLRESTLHRSALAQVGEGYA